VAEPVLKLDAEARLEVAQQVQLPAVVAAVMLTAERHNAVRVVVAAERARHQVGRVDWTLAADDAALTGDLGALLVGRRADEDASERRAPNKPTRTR
jgi:hypothetical protein